MEESRHAAAPDSRPTNTPQATRAAPSSPPAQLAFRAISLPGATGSVTVDYLLFDRSRSRIWVPVGETGSVDVLDIASNQFTRVNGFQTAQREAHGRMRTLGPSAATAGAGMIYIGNRATSEVCPVDETTLTLGSCLRLPLATDGVAYVAASHEVWVTTPKGHSLTVLDASKPGTLAPKLVIPTDGEPEGYAVDNERGLFYTNLEDKNQTLAFDVKTHAQKGSWRAGCNADGPRGLAVDTAHAWVFVACTDRIQVLDVANGGTLKSTLETGAGVDNIEYVAPSMLLYVAAGKASRLTVAHVNDSGELSVVAGANTPAGTRNAVVDANGIAYAVDPGGGRLLVFDAPPGGTLKPNPAIVNH